MRRINIGTLMALVLFAAALIVTSAHASVVVFEATGVNPASGQALDATARFETAGSNLLVTLSNIGADVLRPTDILSGVFFDIAGDPTFTCVSAVLAPGSSVEFGVSDPGGVVGGEWGYGTGLVGAAGGARQGISSAGLGLFGGSTFPGTNLQGPAALDGDQYGIASINDDPLTGNPPVIGPNAFIKHSVVFTFSGAPVGFNLAVSNVHFQYGTALTDPNTPGHPTEPVPEPASVALLGLGMCGIAAWRLRRRAS